MVQVRLFSAVVNSRSMEPLENSMNTFLKHHANDAIEAIQVSGVESARLIETEFIGVTMISYIPRNPVTKKAAGRKSKKSRK